MIPFKPPKYKESAFNCPFCGAYARQFWLDGYYIHHKEAMRVFGLDIVNCAHCGEYYFWYKTAMIYPEFGSAPMPNNDLPDDIKADYEEARSIVSSSPRGASALLRLGIQKLCKHLGEKGENINNDIAELVRKGLPVKIQKALDIVRVIGNNAVHPGQIDLNDNAELAQKLFGLINIIADVMITQPKHVDELYESLPDSQKEQIAKRDNKAT